MNKNILKYIAAGALVMAFSACDNLEDKLLESKVYFENAKSTIEVDGNDAISFDLTSRLTSAKDENVEITYEIADESAIKEFNEKNGTTLEPLPGAKLLSNVASIKAGSIYSESVKISIDDASSIIEGKKYLLPVRIVSSSCDVIKGSETSYFIIKKPIKIFDFGNFAQDYWAGKDYITAPITDNDKFESCTYEALINVDHFTNNSTIMGCEGVLILRIGDTPTVPKNQLQVAGKVDFLGPKLEQNKWYHIALVCDGPKGTATIYVNGEKASEAGLSAMPEKLVTGTEGFSIGLVPGFMWGERPFNGMMSEVRLWTVPRTANQIKENMLGVDANSEGLLFYYKLNASPIVDSTPNHRDPKAGKVNIKHFDVPLMKVN